MSKEENNKRFGVITSDNSAPTQPQTISQFGSITEEVCLVEQCIREMKERGESGPYITHIACPCSRCTTTVTL